MMPHISNFNSLPKQFLSSLKVLFEILDDEKCGFVKFNDIECRWKDEGTRGLPKGVLDSLRKVTPPDGMLTFERFVAGLQIALLQSKAGSDGELVPAATAPREPTPQLPPPIPGKPSSLQLLPQQRPAAIHQSATFEVTSQNVQRSNGDGTGGALMPRDFSVAQHSNPDAGALVGISPRQLRHSTTNLSSSADRIPATSSAEWVDMTTVISVARAPTVLSADRPAADRMSSADHVSSVPPAVPSSQQTRPPWMPAVSTANQIDPGAGQRPSGQRQLEGDQRRQEGGARRQEGDEPAVVCPATLPLQREGHIDGATGQLADEKQRGEAVGGPSGIEQYRRTTPRRRESLRRHTLGHGLEYNAVRRMKQLEREREVLLQGLQCVDLARDWYRTRINDVTETRQHAASSDQPEHAVDSNEERLNFEASLIQEVSQQLKALMDSSEKGFPLHMHLALPQRASLPFVVPLKAEAVNEESGHVTAMLRAQNKMLTREVAQKSDRITQLEREKAMLLRDLFELRSRLGGRRQQGSYDDGSLM